jgi:predicted ATPase/transcriptional regulator with GAF, ATPase, and Fis domain
MIPPGFRPIAELSREGQAVLYRAERRDDGARVLIRAAMPALHGALALAALRREHALLQVFEGPGVPHALALEQMDGGAALVLEDPGGVLLATQLATGPWPLAAALSLGRGLALALATVHRAGVVHKHVNPHTVLADPEAGLATLIDFGLASRLSHETQTLVPPSQLPGRIAYISPEQTGRMNRVVDYRADLYSLGVTLYQVLTGVRPFESDDLLELVHSHIARQPPAPHEKNPRVPEAVSRLVLKLLAKTVEGRYQSASGVAADLETCLAALERSPTIQLFELASRDARDRFTLPQALYGRAAEVAVLLQAFEHACEGPPVLMLVEGYSGVGKTALVQEVHKPITARRGRFLAGKFDQLDRSVPYGALIQALRALVRDLLTGSESQVETMAAALHDALGATISVFEPVIPELPSLVGPLPPVPPLGPTEAQNRFLYALQGFLSIVARPDHPLVLFLDDLQWADRGTLALLESLLTSPAVRYLLVIGAYRDHEVGSDHPLTRTIVQLRGAGARVRAVAVPPLQVAHLEQLVGDALGAHDAEVGGLARLVHEKTGGNAFFVLQFLRALHAEGTITFDHAAGRWRVDLGRVRRAQMTDNVIDLMTRALDKLPAPTTQAVTLASCIGNTFSLAALAIVCASSRADVARDLWPAIHAGLVISLGEGYERLAGADDAGLAQTDPRFRFLHDRVQQAAYERIPLADRRPVHLRLGRLLLAEHDRQDTQPDDDLFDIVNHLDIGAALVDDAAERLRLADLNLAAGRKAKASAAFRSALGFFEAGEKLLPPSAWTDHYDLTLALAMDGSECAYLCGQFERAEIGFDTILREARSPVDRAAAFRMRVVQYENLARYHEAVAAGREALAMFGLVLPADASEIDAAIDAEFDRIDRLRGGRIIPSLVDLPVLDDAGTRSVMGLLTAIWAPAYVASLGALPALLSALMVRLSLQHGNTEDSAYGYVTHAITVGTRQRDYVSAHAFGRLALAVNDRFADLKRRAKVHHMFSCFVNLWREPLATCMPHAKEAHRAGVDTGDFTYASYAIFHESWYALLSGMDLGRFEREYAASEAFLRRIRNDSFADAQQLILHWARALQGRTAHATSLSSDAFDEAEYERLYGHNPFFRVFQLVVRLHLAVVFGDVPRAREAATGARQVIPSLTGTIWTTLLDYGEGLTLALALHDANGPDRARLRAELGTKLTALQAVAENAPANFRRYERVLAAETAALDGAWDAAVTAYETAVQAAVEAGALNDEAWALERYGRYWLRRGNARIGRALIDEAHQRFTAWGATAKARQLESQFPELAVSQAPAWQAPAAVPMSGLDVATVIKASHAVAGELEVGRLVETLLRIAGENAGADRTVLVEEREGTLVVAAQWSLAGGDDRARDNPLADADKVPHALVRLAHRTVQPQIVDDAARDTRWTVELPAGEGPRAMLALPIAHQGGVLGVIYLENHLTPGAFTPARVELMRALAAQAAISLVNARLLAERTEEIARRTRAEGALRDALAEVQGLKDRLQAENLYLQEELRAGHNFEEVVGRSPALLAALGQAERVAPTDSTVLIIGETGTGKEIFARAIHSRSARRDRALVKVNCGAIPDGLVESELFGHVKGAFTGALQKRIGRFELADGGSIFLDEIGELPPDTQVKLLRVLQEQEFEPVGSARSVKVDVRVIAATNRDLAAMVRQRGYRADLFYRLNVFPITVPPLRDRRDDIPLLATFFLAGLAKRLGKSLEGFTARSMDRLRGYEWPGNVRELQNVVERAAILAQGPIVDLQPDLLPVPSGRGDAATAHTLDEVERQHILRVVRQTNWIIEGQKGAATILGLHPNTLRSRMKKLGIAREISERHDIS